VGVKTAGGVVNVATDGLALGVDARTVKEVAGVAALPVAAVGVLGAGLLSQATSTMQTDTLIRNLQPEAKLFMRYPHASIGTG